MHTCKLFQFWKECFKCLSLQTYRNRIRTFWFLISDFRKWEYSKRDKLQHLMWKETCHPFLKSKEFPVFMCNAHKIDTCMITFSQIMIAWCTLHFLSQDLLLMNFVVPKYEIVLINEMWPVKLVQSTIESICVKKSLLKLQCYIIKKQKVSVNL